LAAGKQSTATSFGTSSQVPAMMRALRQTMPMLSSIRRFSYGGDGNPVMHDQASRLQQQPASSSLFHPAASDKSSMILYFSLQHVLLIAFKLFGLVGRWKISVTF
jgi:hypothetical protein